MNAPTMSCHIASDAQEAHRKTLRPRLTTASFSPQRVHLKLKPALSLIALIFDRTGTVLKRFLSKCPRTADRDVRPLRVSYPWGTRRKRWNGSRLDAGKSATGAWTVSAL